jgi:outer membrane immunogenic protein
MGNNVVERFITFGCVAAALAVTSVAAQAADVVRPAYRTAAGVVYNWTGFYAGAHIGGIDADGLDGGFIGGGQVGFNHQVGQWVFGAEWDISGTTASKSFNFGPLHAESRLDLVSTFAGRFGYAFDRWLVYGKLGGAWAHGSTDIGIGIGPNCCGSWSGSSSGLLVGFGTEYALRDNWSAKLEYNFMDFDGGNVSVIKAGVNYRFNFSDPFRY